MSRWNKSIEQIIKQIKFWNKKKLFSESFSDNFNHLCTCGKRLRKWTKEWDKCPNCKRIIPEFI